MADIRRVMIYGGTGATGSEIARALAEHVGTDIVVAGRNGAATERVATLLAAALPSRHFSAVALDIADQDALTEALAGVDLLIVSAPVAPIMDRVALAALAAGTDLLDILVRPLASEKLLPFSSEVRTAGRSIVTQAGFHPGVPGPMMRMAARELDRTDAVHVGMAMRAQLRDARSATEIISEVGKPTHMLENGIWRETSYKDLRRFVFGAPFGPKDCFPLDMPETERVGRALGVSDAGVYAAGFNWFVDYVAFSAMYLAQKLGGEALAQKTGPLFFWGNKWFSPKGDCIEIRAEASGEIAGAPAKRCFCLSSPVPYALTAHCVVAAVRQMIDGPLAAPGVKLMGEEIDPDRLFADLEAFGARVWTE